MTSATTAAQRPQGTFLNVTKVFNKLTMLLAGTRVFPLYGVLEHRGRRSGKLFRTPVVVRPTRDGLIVPMPWGEGTDWYRNVSAAGGCTVRWKGRAYAMTDPQPIDAASVPDTFGGFQRLMMRRLKIERVLKLRFA